MKKNWYINLNYEYNDSIVKMLSPPLVPIFTRIACIVSQQKYITNGDDDDVENSCFFFFFKTENLLD